MKSSYTIWGKVIKGLDIVKAIAKEGVADGTTDGMPKQTIAIEKVRVR
jgi:peptidyl-prolyl cis-trans isomerase B (cyclophilin B)